MKKSIKFAGCPDELKTVFKHFCNGQLHVKNAVETKKEFKDNNCSWCGTPTCKGPVKYKINVSMEQVK
jgi:hypothetical protein